MMPACAHLPVALGLAQADPHQDRGIETFAKRPFLLNFCVPAERDLSTGSNFNPRNTQCIPVVKIIAFLELKQKSTFFKGLV